jgi:hypothetical protein
MSIEIHLTEDTLVVVEGDFGSFADPVEEAAARGAWIIRDRSIPDSREIGYRVMCGMLDEAGFSWPRPDEDAVVIEKMLMALEAGAITEAEFVEWVCLRVATA